MARTRNGAPKSESTTNNFQIEMTYVVKFKRWDSRERMLRPDSELFGEFKLDARSAESLLRMAMDQGKGILADTLSDLAGKVESSREWEASLRD